MLGTYNYTVLLTYIGMLAGFRGIAFAMEGQPRAALICLILAGLCDMFDGKIAATRKRSPQEKRFGVQIDSLSDLICFGVLPAVLVSRHAPGSLPDLCVCGLYLLCALIRLAWFNVDEEERQRTADGRPRTVYLGLPVTTAALIFPAVYGLCGYFRWPVRWVASGTMLAMGLAFLTPFRLKKPDVIGKIGAMLCGAGALALVLLGGGDL